MEKESIDYIDKKVCENFADSLGNAYLCHRKRKRDNCQPSQDKDFGVTTCLGIKVKV